MAQDRFGNGEKPKRQQCRPPGFFEVTLGKLSSGVLKRYRAYVRWSRLQETRVSDRDAVHQLGCIIATRDLEDAEALVAWRYNTADLLPTDHRAHTSALDGLCRRL